MVQTTLSLAVPQTQLCRLVVWPAYRRTLKGDTKTCTCGLQTRSGTVVDWVGSSTEVAVKVTVAADEKTGLIAVPVSVQALPTGPRVTSTKAPRMLGDGAGVSVAVAPPLVAYVHFTSLVDPLATVAWIRRVAPGINCHP